MNKEKFLMAQYEKETGKKAKTTKMRLLDDHEDEGWPIAPVTIISRKYEQWVMDKAIAKIKGK